MFPDGVSADLYLRRGGVSDLVVANITYPGLPTKLYNYDTTVTSFGLSFCDNAIYDSDVAGDVDLPYPSDVIVPLVDMALNPNTACATGGKVNTDKLTLAHWEIDLGPRRAEFRPRPQTGDPTNWTAVLWLLGTMDVPHVAPSTSTGQAPIPLESAYKYDGTFVATKVVQDKVNYTFDGFRYLLSGVTFSAYPRPPTNRSGSPGRPSRRRLRSPEALSNCAATCSHHRMARSGVRAPASHRTSTCWGGIPTSASPTRRPCRARGPN